MLDLKKFNDAQKEAITLGDEHALVLSCPGSGKSTILVNRIAYLLNQGVSPTNILAVTFSRTAANNMVDKLKKIVPNIPSNMTINTFHALLYRLLRENISYWSDNSLSREYELKKLVCEIVCKILKLESKDNEVDVGNILHFITYQKNHALSPEDDMIDMPDMDNLPYSMIIMQQIYYQWERLKQSHKILSFEDMVYEGYKLIRDNDKVRKQLQEKYQYIMIDEVNDVTKLQYEIIRLIGLKSKSIQIIGDTCQTIFGFLGAKNTYMKQFVDDFDSVRVINSNINYRSQGKIVDCYNDFLQNSPEVKYKYYAPAIAHKPKGEDVEYNVFNNALEEANWVGNKIKELVDNKECTYNDVYIIYRVNSQSMSFEKVLSNMDIPYHLSDGLSFYNRKEIRDIICYLKLVHNSNDCESFTRIYNTPNRYFGKVFFDECSVFAQKKGISLYESMLRFPRRNEWRYSTHIDKFERVIRKCNSHMGKYKVGTLIDIIRKELDYDHFISKEYEGSLDNNRIDNLNSFQQQANDYKDLGEFLKVIEKLSLSDEDKSNQKFESKKDRVELKTAHSVKGEEANVVFVVGFSEGLMPHYLNKDEEAERLLGYVALSRAIEKMYVSSILFYNNKELEVSSFLYDCFDEDMIEEKIEECMERMTAKSPNSNK